MNRNLTKKERRRRLGNRRNFHRGSQGHRLDVSRCIAPDSVLLGAMMAAMSPIAILRSRQRRGDQS